MFSRSNWGISCTLKFWKPTSDKCDLPTNAWNQRRLSQKFSFSLPRCPLKTIWRTITFHRFAAFPWSRPGSSCSTCRWQPDCHWLAQSSTPSCILDQHPLTFRKDQTARSEIFSLRGASASRCLVSGSDPCLWLPLKDGLNYWVDPDHKLPPKKILVVEMHKYSSSSSLKAAVLGGMDFPAFFWFPAGANTGERRWGKRSQTRD